MKKNYLAILLLGFASTFAHAETFSVLQVSGNINGGTNSSHRIYSYGWIQSAYYVYAGTHVQAASYLYAGSYVYAGSYMQSPTGLFTNVLRTGGGTATGSYAAAIGSGAANADYSVALTGAITTAQRSVAVGLGATASSYASLVVGQNNLLVGTTVSPTATPSPSAWQAADPLFVVGNGADTNNRSNALTVYKDGTVTMSKAQGDILMGQFGN